MDPLWEKFKTSNAFVGMGDNPVRLVDPTGMGPLERVLYARTFIGKDYSQETDSKLRTEKTVEALKYLDCAELVCRVMEMDGITNNVKHLANTSLVEFLSNKGKFLFSLVPEVGDIAVWDGHVGIVSEVDKDKKIKLIHARGKERLSGENGTCIEPSKYRKSKFIGFFRPKNEDKTENSTESPNNVVQIVTPEQEEKSIKNSHKQRQQNENK